MKSKDDIALYGFQGDMSHEYPSQIIVDVTERCNLACSHCPHRLFKESETFDGTHLDKFLHKKLVDELSLYGKKYCKYLRYTAQGETLLHPDIIEMLQYAKVSSGITINVTTNGTLMTADVSNAMLDAGVDVIDISIDAFSEDTYRLIRRGGELSVTRGNVLRLLEIIKKNGYSVRVVVSFVEQDLNRGESRSFENYWKEMGVDFVVIRPIHSAGGSVESVAKEMKVNSIGKRWPCRYPWERLVLSAKGEICYCPADWRDMAKIAFFKDKTIREVWQGKYMTDLREAHLKCDFSCHQFCGQCPDWMTMKWPSEGRSYAHVMHDMVKKNIE